MAAKVDYARIAAAMPTLDRDPLAVRRRVEGLERLLERAFVVPGINRSVGLDQIVGLIPGAGDLVTGAMGAYLVWEARNLGMSKWQLLRMAGHVGVDTALGAIPLVGDVFDWFYRSNSKNLRMIKRHLDTHHPATAVVEARPA